MNCSRRKKERASERERVQEGVRRSGYDQAPWDAYVEELLKAKAKCDELWKEKTDEKRRKSLLMEPEAEAAAEPEAGSSFENSDEFGFGGITTIGKERWRRRLQTRLCRALQGSCRSQSAH